MSISTRLYIGNRWSLGDVIDVIEDINGQAIKVKPSDHSPEDFGELCLGNEWFSYYHQATKTPLGRVLMLSAYHSKEVISKFRQIAERLGGALEEEDTIGNIQFISGLLDDEDHLQYHLKYAVIRGHSGKADRQGIIELRNSINDWNANMAHTRNREKV
jgi:hypothetical protein